MKNRTRHAATVVAYIIIVLVIPVILTLHCVVEPAQLTLSSDNPTPFGYTISLSLFLFPVLAIIWWFFRNPRVSFQKTAFLWTISLLIPTGIMLDVLFGNKFFVFENHNAVLGFAIPAVGGDIPIEEFVFYILGFTTVLLIYIWCDEFWLEKYNVSDYYSESKNVHRLLQFDFFSLIIGALLIIAAIIYKKLFSGEPAGFPWYFIYITTVALIPSMAFYPSARHFINWRAFSVTFLIIVLTSLIWEVTLALPYQWWGFQHHVMLGFYIGAWQNLPIEEIIVWFSVSYASVIIYEVIKIWQASNKTIMQAFMGR